MAPSPATMRRIFFISLKPIGKIAIGPLAPVGIRVFITMND